VRSAFSRTVLSLALSAFCATLIGCQGADNPKMPDVAPSTAPANTEVPKKVGTGQYGASKKYQDLMNK